MSVPIVDVNSKVGKALAKTLGLTPAQLDRADGKQDGKFEMHRIIDGSQHPAEIVNLRKRIIAPGHFGKCENVYLVDNGDGKIGKGDLFLHSDGYYKGNTNNFTYRMAWFFAPRTVQSTSGAQAARNSQITPQEDRWLKVFEALRGQSYVNAKSKLEAICPRWGR